jgi:hypothetical protein
VSGEKSEEEQPEPVQPGRAAPIVAHGKDEAPKSYARTKIAQYLCSVWKWVQKFGEPLTVVTLLLFGATVALYLATRDLVHDAQHNAERQLRAYIFPQELTVTGVELGKRPTAYMVVKNTGLTPATDVIAWAGVWVGNFPLQAELIHATPEFMKTASRRSVGPGATFTINHAWNEVLTEQHMQMLRSGAAAVFVWGEIIYVDIYGQKRTTGFRSYYGGDTGLRPGGATTTSQEGNNSD